MKTTTIILLILLGAVTGMPAQDAPDLKSLLSQLQKAPGAAWSSYFETLSKEAAQHRKAATKLRSEAKDLLKQAEALEANAKRVEQLRAKREALLELLKSTATPIESAEAPPAKPVTKTNDAKAISKINLDKAFQDQLLPVLDQHCTECHNSDRRKGGLDLTSFETFKAGGASGAVVTPGDPDDSRLYLLVSHQESPKMPPNSDLIPETDLKKIRSFIEVVMAPQLDSDESQRKTTKTAKEVPEPPAAAMPDLSSLEAIPEDTQWGPIRCLSHSPNGPLLASPIAGGFAYLHSAMLKPLGMIPFPPGDVEVLRFSRDGSRILVAGGTKGRKGSAWLFDVRSGRVLHRYGQETDVVMAADMSPLGTRVVLGTAEDGVRVYSGETEQLLFELTEHESRVLSTDVSPDGNYIASGDRAGLLLISEAETGRKLHILRDHKGPINAVLFRPDGKMLASGSDDGTIKLWDPKEGDAKRSINTRQGHVLSLDWIDETLATGGSNGTTCVWNAQGRSVTKTPDLGDWVYAIAAAQRGNALFSGLWTGIIRAHDARNGKPLTPDQ